MRRELFNHLYDRSPIKKFFKNPKEGWFCLFTTAEEKSDTITKKMLSTIVKNFRKRLRVRGKSINGIFKKFYRF